MSARQRITAPAPPRKRQPVTLSTLAEKKALGEPIVMVTAYDYPSAQVAEEAGVDLVLVGDSAAMTVLGYPTTVPVTIDEMLMLAAAVRRGLTHAAADRRPAVRLLRGLGRARRSRPRSASSRRPAATRSSSSAAASSVERARAIVDAGIPVMGHVGLTPQTATALGGYRSQGRTAEQAMQVADDALALQEAGCFAIVFEAVPAELTEAVMPHIEIPVIGIGAGPATDGQVLVFHDLLGIYDGHAARFVKRYANIREQMIDGRRAATPRTCATRSYPEPEHSYTMAPDEAARLRAELAQHQPTARRGVLG